MQELLPVIYKTDGEVIVFQQDNSPAKSTHNTVELLCHETPIH